MQELEIWRDIPDFEGYYKIGDKRKHLGNFNCETAAMVARKRAEIFYGVSNG